MPTIVKVSETNNDQFAVGTYLTTSDERAREWIALGSWKSVDGEPSMQSDSPGDTFDPAPQCTTELKPKSKK